MRQITRTALAFTLPVATGLLLACGGTPAQSVRPAAPKFATATGRATCTVSADRNEPFVIDWPAEKRADLEADLSRAIAVVAYDCNQLRMLSDCELEGSYAYVGVTPKQEVLRLDDGDAIRANLPLSGGALAGRLEGDLRRGSTLDVALAVVGKKRATRTRVRRSQLRGECRGATHFVRSVTVGAFAMQTGTRAKARAAAELFSAGAGGESYSSKHVDSREGRLDACLAAEPEAKAAVAQCGAPLRIELRALLDEDTVPPAAGKSALADEVERPSCPTGFVTAEGGLCVRDSANHPHICEPEDEKDCTAQCERGSHTSCAILGRMYQTGRGVKPDLERALPLLDRACKAGVMPACGRLGEVLVQVPDPAMRKTGEAVLQRSCSAGFFAACEALVSSVPPEARTTKIDVRRTLTRACDGGDADGCWTLGAAQHEGVLLPKNDSEALRFFARACEGEARRGCASYGQALIEGWGTAPDPARGVKTLRTACERGESPACSTLANVLLEGKHVPKDVAESQRLLERACEGTEPTMCLTLAMRYEAGLGVPKDTARAVRYFTRACDAGLTLACGEAKRLSR